MLPESEIGFNDVSLVIQLAMSPAFLLAGIAGLLNVMTGRLARIIDRGRLLDEQLAQDSPAAVPVSTIEHANLDKRRYLASAAITACTASALFVCLVIVVLFVNALFGWDITWVVGILFMISTLALVVGLGYFLREVHLATKTVRFISPRLPVD